MPGKEVWKKNIPNGGLILPWYFEFKIAKKTIQDYGMVVQNGDLPWYFEQRITKKTNQSLLLMEEILHHLEWLKSYK